MISGHRPCEALAEENGELGLGHAPLARRHDPLLLGTVQDQEEQLRRRLVAGEMPPGPDRPAELGIQRLDGVCRVQNPSDIAGKGIERDDLSPGAPPALADCRVFAAPEPSSKAASAASPAAASTAR